MKKATYLVAIIALTGCSATSVSQAVHGNRVAAESNETLCLKYLSWGNALSNRARQLEIQKRQLNCGMIVSPREVELERRIHNAELAAERSESIARKAKRDAEDAEQRGKFCAQGLKAFCY